MNFTHALIISLLFVVCPIHSAAQAVSKIPPKCEKYFSKEEFQEAIEYLEKQPESVKTEDSYYNYYMGMAKYNILHEKKNCSPYFESYLEQVDSNEIGLRGHEQAYFVLGEMYHLNYKFDEAEELFRMFIRAVQRIEGAPEDLIAEVIADAERQIEYCFFGRIQVKNPRNVLIESLGDSINTIYPEYAIVVSQDEKRMIFTSRRPDTRGGRIADEGGYYEDIYTADLVKGSLSESENLLADSTRGQYFHLATDFEYRNFKRMGDNINSKDHDGSIQLDSEDKRLYFYRDADIWSVDISGEGEKDAQKLGYHVNSEHYEPSIFFSYDGEKLFIVSDRPGGYGGLDIYLSEHIEGDEWTTPVNLGPKINTKYNEDAPYLDPDGKTLYFSSMGHSSMGSYDIFRSELKDTTWSPPVNIGFPVNTPADDIYFSMTQKYNRAYYASADLNGLGGTDLYRITFTDERDPIAELFGLVKEEGGSGLKANITLRSQDGEEIIQESDEAGNFFSLLGRGKYYTMNVEADGFNPYEFEFFVPATDEYTQYYQEVHMEHLKDDKGYPLGQKITVYNAFGERVETVYDQNIMSNIERINSVRTIKGDVRVFKQIKFFLTDEELQQLLERDESIDLSLYDQVLVLKSKDADPNDPESYIPYTGPKNQAEILAAKEPEVETPEGTVDARNIDGLFFTVQIGVYSRDVDRSVLKNLDPIVVRITKEGLFRYSIGTFKSIPEADVLRQQIIQMGITDAYVTAYYKGERISPTKATQMLDEMGSGILMDN
jgi:Tol biopolymer transport system component